MIVNKDFKSINVLGKEIHIEISDAKCDAVGADGYFNTLYGIIVLRNEYPSVQRFLVVIVHEVFHALCEQLGTQFDNTLEEILACTIGNTIGNLVHQMIMDETLVEVEEIEDELEEEEEISAERPIT